MAKRTVPKKVTQSINSYLDILKKDRLPIERVFLFGSYARGRQHAWSDIDLCVVSPRFRDWWEAMRYLWLKKDAKKNIDIEPVGFNPKDFNDNISLAQEIRKHGIEIKV